LPTDLVLRMLQITSNPIRKSTILSLKGTSMTFSDVMRACGLNPNCDTGPFFYHLSVLSDSGIVEKKGNDYQLTGLGRTIATLIDSLEREGAFLLKTDKPREGGQREVEKITAKWLRQSEVRHGEYGILLGGPKKPSLKPEESPHAVPEDKPRLQDFGKWIESLPRLEIPPPDFFGHILGFEKNGVKLGSMHIRLAIGARKGTERVMAIARILSIWVLADGYRQIGETKASALRQMMEEFTKQARDHHVQTILVDAINAEDEDLVNVLKQLGYERYLTTYMMRATIA